MYGRRILVPRDIPLKDLEKGLMHQDLRRHPRVLSTYFCSPFRLVCRRTDDGVFLVRQEEFLLLGRGDHARCRRVAEIANDGADSGRPFHHLNRLTPSLSIAHVNSGLVGTLSHAT